MFLLNSSSFQKINYFWNKVCKEYIGQANTQFLQTCQTFRSKEQKSNSKTERKVTATKFSTESSFPQIVSCETSKVAWLRCRSFSVKLLNFFRFKSEKYAKLEVFQKKVPNCFSRKRRIQFWQLCGSTFAKTARRSHSK